MHSRPLQDLRTELEALIAEIEAACHDAFDTHRQLALTHALTHLNAAEYDLDQAIRG